MNKWMNEFTHQVLLFRCNTDCLVHWKTEEGDRPQQTDHSPSWLCHQRQPCAIEPPQVVHHEAPAIVDCSPDDRYGDVAKERKTRNKVITRKPGSKLNIISGMGCGVSWLIGRFDFFCLKGREFESCSSRHVGTLGKLLFFSAGLDRERIWVGILKGRYINFDWFLLQL